MPKTERSPASTPASTITAERVVRRPSAATAKQTRQRDLAAVKKKSRAVVADFWRAYDLGAGSAAADPGALAKLKQELLPDMSPTTWGKLRATRTAQRPRAWFNERTLAQLRNAIEQLEAWTKTSAVVAEPQQAVTVPVASEPTNELSPIQEELAARVAAQLSATPLYAVQDDGITTTFIVADSDARTARDIGMEALHTSLIEARNAVIADLAASLSKASKLPEWLRPDVEQEFAPESMERVLSEALLRAGLPNDAAARIHLAASDSRSVGYGRA